MKENETVKAVADATATAVVEASWSQTRAILRVILVILAVALALWMLYILTGMILLVVLSVFFAYLVDPLVDIACRPHRIRGRARVLPRPLAIAVVYLVIFGSVGAALALLLPRLGTQITQFAQRVPAYVDVLRGRAERLTTVYEDYQLPAAVRDAINGAAHRTIEATGSYLTEGLANVFRGSIGFLPWLVLVPILAFFLLKDAASFRESAVQVLPRGRLRWQAHDFFDEVNSTLAAYIRAQLLACLLIGTVCTIGFSLIGLGYALLLGVIAGLLEFIPLVGPLVAAVIATTIAAFVSAKQAVAVIMFLGVLRIVHDYVTYPRLIRHGIHLHPLVVILAVLSGADLAGITGIFLAIPVVALVSVSYRHWLKHRGSEGLVADLLKPADPAGSAAGPSPPAGAPAAFASSGQAPAAASVTRPTGPGGRPSPRESA